MRQQDGDDNQSQLFLNRKLNARQLTRYRQSQSATVMTILYGQLKSIDNSDTIRNQSSSPTTSDGRIQRQRRPTTNDNRVRQSTMNMHQQRTTIKMADNIDNQTTIVSWTCPDM